MAEPIGMWWRVRYAGHWLIVSNRMAARAVIDGGWIVRLTALGDEDPWYD